MGCANYIFRSFDLDRGESLSVDAKQRLVLVTHKGGKTGDRKIVCAEPSPDAYSAAAASAAASAAGSAPLGGQGTASASGGFSAATSEAAASLAMRTQTIQLLRDGLYRACEAYMNGAIDQYQYNILLLNIDRLMVSLVGVDAIGGTPKAVATTISVGAPAVNTSAGSGQGGAGRANVEGGTVHNEIHIEESPKMDPSGAQAEAIANIVLAANAHSAVPSLCISLLASGELRLDNPGQYSVLKSCDYLLQGVVRHPGQGPPTPNSYRMTPQPEPVAPTAMIPKASAVVGPAAGTAPKPAVPASGAPAAAPAPKEAKPATGAPAPGTTKDDPARPVSPAAPQKTTGDMLAPGPLASAARAREMASASAWRTAVTGEPPGAGGGLAALGPQPNWEPRVERPAGSD
jgi:hypothetical protein